MYVNSQTSITLVRVTEPGTVRLRVRLSGPSCRR